MLIKIGIWKVGKKGMVLTIEFASVAVIAVESGGVGNGDPEVHLREHAIAVVHSNCPVTSADGGVVAN